MTAPPITIRHARQGDFAYVVQTWRGTLASRAKLAKFNRDIFFRVMSLHFGALGREPDYSLLIACPPDDEDTILGFALLTGDELHFLEVRKEMRGLGIARALLEGRTISRYATRTEVGEAHIRPQARGWTYEPRTFTACDGKFKVEIA